MRQIELPPPAVIELGRRRPIAVTGLGDVGKIACVEIKIFSGVSRMTKSKAPAASINNRSRPAGAAADSSMGATA